MGSSIPERLRRACRDIAPGEERKLAWRDFSPAAIYVALRRLQAAGDLQDAQIIRRKDGRRVVCILRRSTMTRQTLRQWVACALKARSDHRGRIEGHAAELAQWIRQEAGRAAKGSDVAQLTEFDVHGELIRLRDDGYLRDLYIEGTGRFSIDPSFRFDTLMPNPEHTGRGAALLADVVARPPRRPTKGFSSTDIIRELRGNV